ncbi:MAG: hypothetical protein MJ069_04760 [Salinivirgaceae bacterium]|nr:hypothetical protein [Salinivirgaceae bacterium]
MKKIILLFCLCMLVFASCHKDEAPAEIPEKYMQFFPYYYGQKLLFKRTNDTIEIEAYIGNNSDAIHNDCHGGGWYVGIHGEFRWKDTCNYDRYSHGVKYKICNVYFSYRDNKDVGSFKLHWWGGQDIKLQDTLILLHNNDINDGYAKFIKNKGLVEMKMSYYPYETWTLIE